MSKLTKREIQLHDQAVCLLQKEHLSHEDKLFIFENFREDAEHINSKSGAFFTPFGLANDFTETAILLSAPIINELPPAEAAA